MSEFIVDPEVNEDHCGEIGSRRKLLALYSHPMYVKWFTAIRFWHASYDRIAQEVPDCGLIYDIGCGYGIFANYLGLMNPRRRIVGMELNPRKMQYAEKGVSQVAFVQGNVMDASFSSCRGVVLLDLLHHLDSFAEQEALLERCWQLLEPGGRLLLKEVDPGLGWRSRFTKLVDRTLYPWDRFYFRTPGDFSLLMEKMGARTRRISLLKGPLAHYLVTCDRHG